MTKYYRKNKVILPDQNFTVSLVVVFFKFFKIFWQSYNIFKEYFYNISVLCGVSNTVVTRCEASRSGRRLESKIALK